MTSSFDSAKLSKSVDVALVAAIENLAAHARGRRVRAYSVKNTRRGLCAQSDCQTAWRPVDDRRTSYPTRSRFSPEAPRNGVVVKRLVIFTAGLDHGRFRSGEAVHHMFECGERRRARKRFPRCARVASSRAAAPEAFDTSEIPRACLSKCGDAQYFRRVTAITASLRDLRWLGKFLLKNGDQVAQS